MAAAHFHRHKLAQTRGCYRPHPTPADEGTRNHHALRCRVGRRSLSFANSSPPWLAISATSGYSHNSKATANTGLRGNEQWQRSQASCQEHGDMLHLPCPEVQFRSPSLTSTAFACRLGSRPSSTRSKGSLKTTPGQRSSSSSSSPSRLCFFRYAPPLRTYPMVVHRPMFCFAPDNLMLVLTSIHLHL